MKKGGILFFLLLLIGTSIAYPTKKLHLPKLRQKVQINFDRYGIPHIRAQNTYDLLFAQGYIIAQDRLFQMDYNRHAANGTLAEILGKEKLDRDLQVRILGFRDQGEAIYRKLPKKTKEAFQAYADGINYYIRTHKKKLPPEYRKLNIKPELWSPIDSLVIGRGISWGFSGSLMEEAELTMLFKDIGLLPVKDIFQIHPADPTTISRTEEFLGKLPQDVFKNLSFVAESLEDLYQNAAFLDQKSASNNWVVSKEKSATGHPLLANDPHLGLSQPSAWYEIHLQAPGWNVMGVTFPGEPGILLGHNNKIAWGATVVGYDVLDLYIESRYHNDPNAYLYKGKKKPLKVRTVKLHYKEGNKLKSVDRKILYTHHGPVIRDEGKMMFAFRWTGAEPTLEAQAFMEIMQAQNLAQFKKALRNYKVGAMNFVYADVDGNIFWQATGEVPIRPKGCLPYLAMSGASGNCEWQGTIPYDQLPHLENPPQGFVATANNRPISRDYPYYIGYHFDAGFRAHRITQLLQAKKKISFRDMQKIQGDVLALDAEMLKPLLFEAFANKKSISPDTTKALNILRQWDNRTTAKSPAPTIFYTFLKRASRNLLLEKVGETHFSRLGRFSEITLAIFLKKPNKDPWFDLKATKKKETKQDLFRRSFKEALSELKKTMDSPAMNSWKWGPLHTLTLNHPVFSEYNLGPFPLPGGLHTVNVANFNLLGNFSFGHGPSMRFVAELKGQVEHARNTIAGGESGDPKSKHHDDLLKLWLKRKTHPMWFTKQAIQKHTEEKWILSK